MEDEWERWLRERWLRDSDLPWAMSRNGRLFRGSSCTARVDRDASPCYNVGRATIRPSDYRPKPKEAKMTEDQELLALMQEQRGVTSVKVVHTQDMLATPETLEGGKMYTYKTDTTLIVGDRVIVRNRNGLAIGVVVKIDVGIDLDNSDRFDKMAWVIDRVDVAKAKAIEESEADVIRQLRAQRAKKRLREIGADLEIDRIASSMQIGAVMPETPPSA